MLQVAQGFCGMTPTMAARDVTNCGFFVRISLNWPDEEDNDFEGEAARWSDGT
jgi:hypothetical protein